MVKDQVDAGGNDDAAHGRQHGKHGLTRILELADRHLVLKLNAHQQKKIAMRKSLTKAQR